MTNRCEIRGCRNVVELIYLGHGICAACWNEFTRNDAPPDALRMALGIAERGPETDEEMHMSNEQGAAPAEAETAKEDATVKAKSKRVKATGKKTPAKNEKKVARKPKEKVELRTLALRVTNAEFDLVHKAAGPRNLSQFMKSTVLAAAQRHLAK